MPVPNPALCPTCGESALPVLYGRLNKDGEKWVAQKKAIAGGCVQWLDSASHQCPKGHAFLSPEQFELRKAWMDALVEMRKKKADEPTP
jgi:hypothetical protein